MTLLDFTRQKEITTAVMTAANTIQTKIIIIIICIIQYRVEWSSLQSGVFQCPNKRHVFDRKTILLQSS